MPGDPAAEADDVEGYLTRLYTEHYRGLLRLAVLCVSDRAAAEDVVQSAFVSVYQARSRLKQPEAVLTYLRKAVLNQARSLLRGRQVAAKYQPRLVTPDSTMDGTESAGERAVLRAALAQLPPRQREAVVLRYYCDLSQEQTAEVMGVGVGAVKSNCSRGVAALSELLKEADRD